MSAHRVKTVQRRADAGGVDVVVIFQLDAMLLEALLVDGKPNEVAIERYVAAAGRDAAAHIRVAVQDVARPRSQSADIPEEQ
jgi:hypothetical protein